MFKAKHAWIDMINISFLNEDFKNEAEARKILMDRVNAISIKNTIKEAHSRFSGEGNENKRFLTSIN